MVAAQACKDCLKGIGRCHNRPFLSLFFLSEGIVMAKKRKVYKKKKAWSYVGQVLAVKKAISDPRI